MSVGHLSVFFEKNVCLDPLPIFQLNCFAVELLSYVFWMLALNQIYDFLIFFPFSRFHFYLLMVLFSMQNLFSFISSYLFISTFIAFAFGVKSKKSLSRPVLRSLFSGFFVFRNFIVWCPMLNCLIHFELIFIYGVRYHSSFILSHMAVWFSQYH